MYHDWQCTDGTPEEGMDVTYSCTFNFHSPYLFWVGGKGILARMLIRSKEVCKLADEPLEIPQPSFSGLAFQDRPEFRRKG